MTISPTLDEAQSSGFPVGGDPSIAVDLVDTVANVHTAPVDLLIGKADAWWSLQSVRLPASDAPTPEATSVLRSTIRELLEARIDGGRPSNRAVSELNRFAESATSRVALEVTDDVPRVTTRWRLSGDGNPRLAVIASDAIALLGDADRSQKLRRCANPTCSMLFLAENPRRVWCASNICGNRARVARHQHRPDRTN